MAPFRLSVILLLLLCAFRASAAPPALSVVPSAGTVLVSSKAAFWQFAPRSLSDEKPLTHTFLLHNDTKTTLTIERVAVSCDCVQALISESKTLPVTVSPGQTVPVQVSLSMRRLVPGPVSKSTWIYLHGADNAGVRLEMCGTVRDEAVTKPIKL
jgi:hypothetical protein